jgi:hypothetical protein
MSSHFESLTQYTIARHDKCLSSLTNFLNLSKELCREVNFETKSESFATPENQEYLSHLRRIELDIAKLSEMIPTANQYPQPKSPLSYSE